MRELRNCIESMVVMARGELLETKDVPPYIQQPELEDSGGMSVSSVNLEQAEKELIRRALKSHDGNREQAAKLLGIGERTLYRKIKKYGLS